VSGVPGHSDAAQLRVEFETMRNAAETAGLNNAILRSIPCAVTPTAVRRRGPNQFAGPARKPDARISCSAAAAQEPSRTFAAMSEVGCR